MASEQPRDRSAEVERAMAALPEPGEVPAWQEIDTGRYMPRRIRGSCKGRALG